MSISFLSGKFATGTIVRKYEPGSWIPVIVDITTNHGGYFIFKLCPNNDITQDPSQPCFDQHVLEVLQRVREEIKSLVLNFNSRLARMARRNCWCLRSSQVR